MGALRFSKCASKFNQTWIHDRVKNGTHKRSRLRKLLAEQLERRDLLATDWQNPLLYADVNDDGEVAPIDVLQVINQLSRNSRGTPLDLSKPVGNSPYFDSNGDGELAPLDVLLVINYLSRRGNVTNVDLALQSDSGVSSNDFVTNDATIVGNVTSNPGTVATVKARINRGPVVDVTLDNDGKFLFAPSASQGLSDGNLLVKIVADSGVAKRLAKLQFTLDSIAPAINDPHIAEVDDTGPQNDDNVTRIAKPRIAVTSEAGARVKLKVDNKFLFDGQPIEPTVLLNQTLNEGPHQLSAIATDVAGNTATSRLIPIVIDTIAPPTPDFNLAATSDTGAQGDRSTDYSRVTLSGMTEGNSFITISGKSDTIRTAGDGSFRIPQFLLNAGTNTVALTVTDLAGNSNSGQADFTRLTEIVSADPVIRWNQEILKAIQLDATTPPLATRGMAMMSIAMLDVVSAIEKTPSYLVSLPAPAEISTEVAVSTAAYQVLKYLYPAQATSLDAIQSSILNALPPLAPSSGHTSIPSPLAPSSGRGAGGEGQSSSDTKSNGIAFGTSIANAVIAIRQLDGWDRFVDYVPSSATGKWQPTAPMYDVAQLPQWGDLTPFAISNIDTLLPSGPPNLTSTEYATALNEVKSLGAINSTTRTDDQKQAARFWADGGGTYTPPGHWNQIATQVASSQGLSLGENARLFAMLNVALSDSSIAAWDAKYTYEAWRPITAIQSAADDNNDQTTADPNWSSLLITPPHPEYVSGHSTYSAAAAGILSSYFGSNVSFSTTSLGLPGVTRNFTSFNEAAAEAGRSRIYGGIHFEFSNQDGQQLGRSVADAVLKRFTVSDDTLAPVFVFMSPDQNKTVDAVPTVSGWAFDNLSGVANATVQLDNGSLVPLTIDSSGHFIFQPTLVLDGTADGQHVLHFQARDNAGLQSQNYDFKFNLDTLAPTVTIDAPIDGGTITAGQSLSGTANGTGSSLRSLTYKIDSGATMPISFDRQSSNFNTPLDLSRLAVGQHTITVTAVDSAGHQSTATRNFTLSSVIPLTIKEYAPNSGASDVGSTFRPKVVFTRPIKSSSLTTSNFYATDTSNTKLPATIVPSQDGSFAWLFLTNPMPGGSTISIHMNGDTILSEDGTKLDADNNGTPGGEFVYQFSTVSLAPLLGTSLTGTVIDPGNDLKPMTFDDIRAGADGALHTADDVFLNPIANARIYILGLESQAVFTDAQGRFTFASIPSGNIKLAIDGRTATNAPIGTFWPEMVMDLNIAVGQANTVMGTMGTREEQSANRDRQEVYLPRLQNSILQNVSSTTTTTIGVDANSAPNLTPDQRNNLKIEIPPNSLISPDGNPLSNAQVGISTVPPELVRDMLPPGLLQHTFDITIQAPGAATFAEPAQITLPNVFNAPPGTKLNFLSFDHTTGRLVIDGTATVSPDGQSVTTDPDTGVTHPGWHGMTPPGTTILPPCVPIPFLDSFQVPPTPTIPKTGDYFLSDDAPSITFEFTNNAVDPTSKPGSCTSILPLLVELKVSPTGSEFLNEFESHILVLLPNESRKIEISSKDLADIVPKLTRNRLYGTTIEVRAFPFSILPFSNEPIAESKLNIYRFYDASDSSPDDGKIQIPPTIVDADIEAHPTELEAMRRKFEAVEIQSITVLTHGFALDYKIDDLPVLGTIGFNGDSLRSLSDAIYGEFRKKGPTWLLDYDISGGRGTQGFFDTNTKPGDGSILPTEQEISQNSRGNLVLQFDWAPESNQNSSGWTEAAADALYAMLRGLGLFQRKSPDGGLYDPRLHMIGHSFGCAVTSEAVERILAANIPVDHVTYLDPHDFDDPEVSLIDQDQKQYLLGQPDGYGVVTWKGVVFTDVYYQTRGRQNPGSAIFGVQVPRGRPIPGAYNVLMDVELPHQYSSGTDSDHGYVESCFYVGTVTGTMPSSCPASKFSELFDGNTDYLKKTGYQFSRNAQGNSLRQTVEPKFFGIDTQVPIHLGDGLIDYNGYFNGLTQRDVAHTSLHGDLIGDVFAEPYLVSSEKIVKLDGSPAAGVVKREFDNFSATPTASKYEIINGDFSTSNVFSSNIYVGWSHHGGGGTGIFDDRSGFMQLSAGHSERTHNWFYMPDSARSIEFDYKVTQHSEDDFLQLYLDDVAIGDLIPLDKFDTSYRVDNRVAIPRSMSEGGQVHTLKFAIVSRLDGKTGSAATVEIDNVSMSEIDLVEKKVDVRFATTFDVLLGTTPKPNVAFVPSTSDLKFTQGNTIEFNPTTHRSEAATAKLQFSGTLPEPNSRSKLDIPVTAKTRLQRETKDSSSVGPIIGIYAESEPNVLRSEFKLDRSGNKATSKLILQNLGDERITIKLLRVEGGTILNSNFDVLPNQKIPLEISIDSANAISKEILIESDVPTSMKWKVWAPATDVTATGEGPSRTVVTGKPFKYGNDYVMIDFPSQSGAPAIRMRSNDSGGFEQVFMPSNQAYHVSIFDPDSGLVSHSYGVSSESGLQTKLPTPYFRSSIQTDSDSDGLPDDIEAIIGSSKIKTDTNGDGISDFAAIQQGLDPVAGLAVATGVIASAQLLGESKEIVVSGSTFNAEEQTAYVATGSHGLAIVDISQFQRPNVKSQLDLPGDATDIAIDTINSIAVVATNSGGLQFVDVRVPTKPSLLRTIQVTTGQVEVFEGVAFAAVGALIVSYDVLTGEELENKNIGSGTIVSIARDGTSLFAIDSAKNLQAIDIRTSEMTPRGKLTMPVTDRLFVGGGVAYVSVGNNDFSQGFATANVSNIDTLVLLSGADATNIVGTGLAANGSGLAVSVGSAFGIGNVLHVVDVTDPTNTGAFLTQFTLPAAPYSIAIAGGIAYVADGTGGLQVVNYRAFDSLGISPTISFAANAKDADPSTASLQVLEGSPISISTTVLDDVQVRNVELLVNNQVVQNDVSFPFDLSFAVPKIVGTTNSMMIQVRATDTGGNSKFSDPITVNVVPDTIPPIIDLFSARTSDVDLATAGTQMLLGAKIPIRYGTNDNGGIQRVEILENGQVVGTKNGRNGFVQYVVPSLAVGESSRTISLRIRAVDGAGNTTTSSAETFTLVPDTFPPKIAKINLRSGDIKQLGEFSLNIDFDEPMSPSSLVASNFQLKGPNAVLIASKSVQAIDADSIRLAYQFEIVGSYNLSIGSPEIRDVAGNSLGISDFEIPFSVTDSSGSLFPNELFDVGGTPRSSATGDFNGDGKLDLVTANSSSNSVSVLIGKGNGTFNAPQSYAVGANPGYVTLGDFNGDGRLDLAIANYRNNNVSILIGKGDGTFNDQQSFAVGSRPVSVTVGDFNRDGHLDLATLVLTDDLGSGSVSILIGIGDGTFKLQQSFSVASLPRSLATGDFNGDGRLDIAVANYNNFFGGGISVMIGIGDGTFNELPSFAVSSGISSITASDFNGDDRLDLVAADENSNNVAILTGKGDGTFENRKSFAVGTRPRFVTVGDFNSDGRLDLATGNSGVFRTSTSVSILVGNGDGTFSDQQSFPVPSEPSSITVGDYNGDGQLDFATTFDDTNSVLVLLGKGDGTLVVRQNFAVGSGPSSVNFGDFNGDGRLDLVAANDNSNNITIVTGKGDGTFNAGNSFAVGTNPQSIAVGDFNSDGRLDLATASYGSNSVSILIGKGDGSFHTRQSFAVEMNPRSVTVGDFNRDGLLDLATANGTTSGSISVLLGVGDGTFNTPLNFAVGSYPGLVTVDDFDADGRLDLAFLASSDSGRRIISILIGRGDGTFNAEQRVAVVSDPTSFTVGDLNSDGRLDIISITVGNAGSSRVTILTGKGDGTFFVQTSFTVNSSLYSILVGDFNGDGRLDLASANTREFNGRNETVSIQLGRGDGTFDRELRFAVDLNPWYVAAFDVNGDGRLDIVAKNDGSNFAILINQLGSTTAKAIVALERIGSNSDAENDAIQSEEIAKRFSIAQESWINQGIPSERFAGIRFEIATLSNKMIGPSTGSTINIDDAAGFGWFVDATPDRDEEYQHRGTEWVAETGDASRCVGLLTVIEHELGHLLGLEHDQLTESSLMSPELGVGTRRLLSPNDVDRVFSFND